MVTKLYAEAKCRLMQRGVEDYEFEAKVIFETVFGRDFALGLYTGKYDRKAEDFERNAVTNIVKRRVSGEPLQYIIGEWEFYGYDFYVGEGVLIPRQDTELIVDSAIKYTRSGARVYKILDLCSGSGCIPVTIEKCLKLSGRECEIYAVEFYDKAYAFLEKNIRRHESRVKPFKLDALSRESASGFKDIDIITCNPPYLTQGDMNSLQTEVSFEPKEALFGGNDGLVYYREISNIWKDSLRGGGMIVFEIGCTQGADVMKILERAGYKEVRLKKDYNGKNRIVSALKE